MANQPDAAAGALEARPEGTSGRIAGTAAGVERPGMVIDDVTEKLPVFDLVRCMGATMGRSKVVCWAGGDLAIVILGRLEAVGAGD